MGRRSWNAFRLGRTENTPPVLLYISGTGAGTRYFFWGTEAGTPFLFYLFICMYYVSALDVFFFYFQGRAYTLGVYFSPSLVPFTRNRQTQAEPVRRVRLAHVNASASCGVAVQPG